MQFTPKTRAESQPSILGDEVLAGSNAFSEPIFSSNADLQQTPLPQSPVSQLLIPNSPGIHTLNSPSSCTPQGTTASSKTGLPTHPLSPLKPRSPLSRIPDSTPEAAFPAPHYLSPLSITPPHSHGHFSESYRARSHLPFCQWCSQKLRETAFLETDLMAGMMVSCVNMSPQPLEGWKD